MARSSTHEWSARTSRASRARGHDRPPRTSCRLDQGWRSGRDAVFPGRQYYWHFVDFVWIGLFQRPLPALMTASHALGGRALLSLALVVSASFRRRGPARRGAHDVSGSGRSVDARALRARTADSCKSAGCRAHSLCAEFSSCHGIDASGATGRHRFWSGWRDDRLWLSSGWMPLAEPTASPNASRQSSTAAGSRHRAIRHLTGAIVWHPGIPLGLDISHANVAVGFSLFALNCAPATPSQARRRARRRNPGAALHGVTKTMIWEAVRTGPGNMPRFGPGTLSSSQVDDIVGTS